ncbi:MAG: flippase [Alistipes sp.]|nr:flippase [Alistipes sp.]
MSLPSIRSNFFYKALLTISTYVVSFVTFPYVSRALGVERVGLVNFVDNTVSYFMLFAALGVVLLGTREIAMARDDKEERSRVFCSVLGLNMLFTIITLIVYAVIVLSVGRFAENASLFWVGAAKILFTTFLVEWLYTGLENFRYITLRSLAIKLLYVVAIFLFVRSSDDYFLYFVMTVMTVVANALINILYAKNFVSLNWRYLLNVKRYFRENIMLGIYSIMTSMYITFNVMYLGLVADNVQVGYYTTAFKLYTIMMGLFSSYTSVMMPRMSALLAEGNNDAFRHSIRVSFDGMMRFIVPLTLSVIVLAPEIIGVISGLGFEGPVQPMRIIMPAAIAVGIAQVLAIQVLMPLRREKVLLVASIVGAVVGLTINITIVPTLQSVGSAVVLLASEIVVTLTYVAYVVRHKLIPLPFDAILQNLWLSLPTVAICIACSYFIENDFVAVGVALTAGGGIWAVLNAKHLKRYLSRR